MSQGQRTTGNKNKRQRLFSKRKSLVSSTHLIACEEDSTSTIIRTSHPTYDVQMADDTVRSCEEPAPFVTLSDSERKRLFDKYHQTVKSFKTERCEFCSEVVKTTQRVLTRPFYCSVCKQKRTDPKFISEMSSLDPLPMPVELRNFPLSFIEEQLIALVQVNQYVYVRKTGAIATKGESSSLKKCFHESLVFILHKPKLLDSKQ